jgi:hypothetical protein
MVKKIQLMRFIYQKLKVKIKVSYKYGVQIAFPQEVATLKVTA